MKILFLTGHSFDPSGRKASIHFLASGLKAIGNDVYVLTVGVDIVRLIFSRSRNKGVLRYLKWRDDPDGLIKRVNIGIIHQPAREKGFFSKALRLIASGKLPKYVIKSAGAFDAVIIDSGLAVNYFGFIREKYPEAYIMYNAADCLASVGYSGEIINKEKDVLLNADSVRTPSKLLANKFPIGSNYFIIPHGVDKDILLSELDSPFLKDSVNGVLVGNTLLDWDALFAIAIAAERDIIHVFGTPLRAGTPKNIILHGEVGFSKLAPYIQHASYALAPYKLSAENAYIAESSLKVRQYRTCGLPIVCPSTLSIEGDDVFKYDPANLSSVDKALKMAVQRGRKPYYGELKSWDEVAHEVGEIIASGTRNGAL